MIRFLPAFAAALLTQVSAELPDLALQPPRVTAEFDPDTVKSTRGAQGVPAIERAGNGRLWAAWYAGPSPRGVESSRSYVVLATSSDDGVTWSEQLLVRARRFVHGRSLATILVGLSTASAGFLPNGQGLGAA